MSERISPPWAWLESPPQHLAAYAGTGLWDERTIAQAATALAEADPGFVALIEGETRVTRAEIVADAEALSAAMYARGLRPGDVIAFQVPNWREAMVINTAAAMSGLVINPIVPIYRDHEVSLMLADCGARAVFVPSSFRRFDYAAMARRLAEVLPDLDHVFTVRGEGADDYAALIEEGRALSFARPKVDPLGVKMVLYTSGTTGRPKGVLHSHVSIARILRESGAYWGLTPGEATLMPSPVTHVSGYANGLEAPFICGTRTVLMESWNAAEALALIDRHQAVGTVAATPFLVELAAAARETGNRLPSFRFFACGGAAVPADLIPAANAAFDHCRAFRVFGASEVPLVTFGWPNVERLAATTDGAIVDYDIRVVDHEDRDLPDGQEGEILARGPGMMLGYADEAQTREAITTDGYFRTGDLGVRTSEGAITITGRKKDLIIRGGENISAKEIEDVLHAHPGVREAAVVAMPHERLGEGVCAYIIAAGEAPSPQDLAAHIADSGLAKQKTPERFEFREDFPRTASGKVRKDVLRADVKALVEATV
ncbi:AMP-dependent synthetase and ligase [Novosphingobium barchaimii LL02]|uniref:AMP-dependent synthetase and ligase n=1 Tax=Novosphingobium barchaimii LL02 TaxID=1114963 RepID=A0A0J7Y854_9SPHN|nr:AMP-binding protein [Novosphingobium barchaimii]KMS60129.1 AMP-dependent synthetase and ligase [Novosphingobium barchaimii LL02]